MFAKYHFILILFSLIYYIKEVVNKLDVNIIRLLVSWRNKNIYSFLWKYD